MITSPTPLGRGSNAFAIVDLENQVILDGRRVSVANASNVLDQIDFFVSEIPTCAALTQTVLAPLMPHLANRNWSIDLVPIGPDAADLALIERAAFAIERGCTDLVVVSGDHIFATLADHARLHVVTYHDRLSRELASVATSVSFLGTNPGVPMAA